MRRPEVVHAQCEGALWGAAWPFHWAWKDEGGISPVAGWRGWGAVVMRVGSGETSWLRAPAPGMYCVTSLA